eukprot:GHRR01011301.1.p1 GENE.GHRR01011301.1~~GHRR01011301.1.p1  ORF type:complete len:838 (+),score=278.05 GHRR01011301.1:406-2919(+)
MPSLPHKGDRYLTRAIAADWASVLQDVGFTDMDSTVINLYFHHHYPAAIKLAREAEDSPANIGGDKFRYLTHSWLISLFLDCPPGIGVICPNAAELEAVKEAIADGVIAWHAAPFNPQYEVFDASLLGDALDMTHSLDARFGLQRKQMISLRDVPGLTRAAIPVLTSRGIKGLTGGVNGFSAPPGVPHSTPFIWKDEESEQQIFAMWHAGGYAGVTEGLDLDGHDDCVRVEGFKHVLCANWRSDNIGPPDTLKELQQLYNITRSQWPGAQVTASTLNTYLGHLQDAVASGLQLPVVTGEIGDTWVHGIASDPGKMADYRAVLRGRLACEQDPACNTKSAAYKNFTRLLIKVPEHTWGVSFNSYFGDVTNYTNAWLHQLLSEGEGNHQGLAVSVESWRRQRAYIDWALQALPPDHPVLTYTTADKAARAGHSGISSANLANAGHVSLLPTAAAPALTSPAKTGSAAATTAAASNAGSKRANAVCRQQAQSADGLLFCSRFWLIQVDRKTGGLVRLQRVYGEGPDAEMGIDWAGGAPQPAATVAKPATAAAAAIAAAQTVQPADAAQSDTMTTAASQLETLARDRVLGLWGNKLYLQLATLWQWFMSLKSAVSDNSGASREAGRQEDAVGAASMSRRKLLYGPTSTLQQMRDPLWQQQQSAQQQQHTAAQHTTAGSDGKRRRRRSSAFAELQYNVYNLDDYQFVWDNYAYMHPVWVGDFGKWNLSASSNISEVAKPKLKQVFHHSDDQHGLMLHLQLKFPKHLVREAGAPETAWLVVHSPQDTPQLHITLVWQNKTATRLPEALWLRFKPAAGAVDKDTWVMRKLASHINPTEVWKLIH